MKGLTLTRNCTVYEQFYADQSFLWEKQVRKAPHLFFQYLFKKNV